MKKSKSKRTRKQNSPSSSNRRLFQPSSIRGLTTSREESMMEHSSQMSFTQKTERSHATAFSQQFDFIDDDMEKQDNNQVFADEEQQKAVYKILQVARKGKINQKNAFEIPLKLMENSSYSTGPGKFWKFASELLNVSMNIYEKRIENAWVSTNIVHDKLARMAFGSQKKEQNNENEQNVNQPTRSQFHMISVQDFRDQRNMQNVEVGEETLEDITKINVSNLKCQFTNDPLFQKKLKAFDNTSVRGLLLNVFDLSSACEVELFCTQNKTKVKQKASVMEERISEGMAKEIEESFQTIKSHPFFFASVSQFKAQNTINENQESKELNSIGFIRKQPQNGGDPLFQDLEAFIREPLGELQSQMQIFDDQNGSTVNFKSPFEDPQTYSGDFSQDQVFDKPSFFSIQERSNPMMFASDQLSFDSNSSFTFHSVTTPWQMQFHEGKLRKKVGKRGPKRQGKKNEKIETHEVQFNAVPLDKKQILKVTKQSNMGAKRKKKFQNLIPPQLAVYQKVNFKKTTQMLEPVKQQKTEETNFDIPDFLAPDPSMIQPIQEKKTLENFNQISEELLVMGQSQVRRSGSFIRPATSQPKYTNIRQTKSMIYEKSKTERELRLSQVDEQYLTPASILITFLHIANEKNMSVRNTASEEDVILSWE